MSLLIFHGDNTVASRQALAQELTTVARQDTAAQTVRFDARSLNPAELEEALGSSELFGSGRVVVIEGLHSIPRGQRRQRLVELTAAAAADSRKGSGNENGIAPTRLILWEQRQLTTTMLKQFPQARVKSFKASKAIFKWVQSMVPSANNPRRSQLVKLHQAVDQDSAWVCLAMAARQLRLLILLKAGGRPQVAPFILKQLQAQARLVSLADLIEWQKRLAGIDLNQKTGQSSASLEQELDLWQLSLYIES